MVKELLNYIDRILLENAGSGCRAALVCHVENESLPGELVRGLCLLPDKTRLVISNQLDDAVKTSRATMVLGSEADLLVYDAREGLNPDVLGIISGALVGDGVLILLLPSLGQWKKSSKPFVSHVKSLLNAQGVVYFNGQPVEEAHFDKPCAEALTQENLEPPFKTHDQMMAVKTIVESIEKNNTSCIVLTSGRGRGKSSALGIVASNLVQQASHRILVTAPRLSVADPLFQQLQQLCVDGQQSHAEFACNDSSVEFIAPDSLLENLPEADVLLIDEAAAIPLSMLKQLLTQYKKIIFSTTTHGYEGTGRGFVIKFYQLLDTIRPGWINLQLHQPIRWSMHDPLEQWIEQLLFLNVRLADIDKSIPEQSQLTIRQLTPENLLQNSAQRCEVFSLLVFAHYRTRPSDFQYLLDDAGVRLYVLEYQQQVVGVLMMNREGGFDEKLSRAIYRGERRPKGHLLAQTLCFHAGIERAASLSYGRIMRIAIHPQLQAKGLGSFFLKQVIQREKQLGLDVLGSSFSATAELLNFWQKAGMEILRFGFSRDHVSAAFSAVVGMPVSDKGKQLVDELQLKFKRNFSIWKSTSLSGLSQDVCDYIVNQGVIDTLEFSRDDYQDVVSFVKHKRNFDACYPAIVRMLQAGALDKFEISDQQKHIIETVMQNNKNWKKTVKNISANGRADAEQKFKACLQLVLDAIENIENASGA